MKKKTIVTIVLSAAIVTAVAYAVTKINRLEPADGDEDFDEDCGEMIDKEIEEDFEQKQDETQDAEVKTPKTEQ